MPYDIIVGRNEADKQRFGNEGLIYIGKQFVRMGELTSLSNRILMDVARSHVILIAGKRGSGKSYTLGVIAEEISTLPENISSNISCLIFDTMGIFWTMKYPNEREIGLLREWGMLPQRVPIKIFVPFGFFSEYEKRGLPVDNTFALKVSELTGDDWCITFGLKFTEPVAVMIQRVISRLREQLEDSGREYDLEDIIKEVKGDREMDVTTKQATISLFEGAKTWKIFARKNERSIEISQLVEGGKTTIIDLSCYSSLSKFNIRALVIGLISRKLFNERTLARKSEEIQAVQRGIDYLHYKQKREMPLVWLFIDEAHEFLPKEGETAASDTLKQILREGRQPGISLILATQQPGVIHRDVMTQADIVIAHRVTAKPDLEALNLIMQSYLFQDIKSYMNSLPDVKGSAIVLDDSSERIYPIRIRARFTWHGGEAPTSVVVRNRI